MKTEKVMATAALAASVLALVFSMGSFAPAKPLPPADTSDSAYMDDFEEKIALLKHSVDFYEDQVKHGKAGQDKVEDTRLEYDKTRLALQRLKTGRRTFPTFVDSLMQRQTERLHLARMTARAELGVAAKTEVNECRLDLLDTELRLQMQTRRVSAETLQKVEELLRSQPDKGLTEAQVAELVELEPAPRGR